jgi:hypothetical protein
VCVCVFIYEKSGRDGGGFACTIRTEEIHLGNIFLVCIRGRAHVGVEMTFPDELSLATDGKCTHATSFYPRVRYICVFAPERGRACLPPTLAAKSFRAHDLHPSVLFLPEFFSEYCRLDL